MGETRVLKQNIVQANREVNYAVKATNNLLSTNDAENKLVNPHEKVVGIVSGIPQASSASTSSSNSNSTGRNKWFLSDLDIGKPVGKGKLGSVYLAREKHCKDTCISKIFFLKVKFFLQGKCQQKYFRAPTHISIYIIYRQDQTIDW